MTLSHDDNEGLVEYVSELLGLAGMALYTNSPRTSEHNHIARPGLPAVCVHEYTADSGRRVRLFIDGTEPRKLVFSVTLEEGESFFEDEEPTDYPHAAETPYYDPVVQTLEHILSLPDAEEPPHEPA